MQLTITLNVIGDTDKDQMLQVGTINLTDELFQCPGLALHKAIRSETRALLLDMQPYVVEAVYRAAEKEAK